MLLKQCTFCKEYIQYEATKCKHCGSEQPTIDKPKKQKDNTKNN